MDVPELAISEFGDPGVGGVLIDDLNNVADLAVGFGLVVDYLGLEVDHISHSIIIKLFYSPF